MRRHNPVRESRSRPTSKAYVSCRNMDWDSTSTQVPLMCCRFFYRAGRHGWVRALSTRARITR